MARSTRRARLRSAVVALFAAGALTLSGCAATETMGTYAAGDGARAELANQIRAENILIITEAEGSPGTMTGSLVNEWSQDADVTLAVDGLGEAISLTVPGSDTVLISPDHESIELPSVPVAPGGVLDVQISTSESGSLTLPVPVLDGTIDPYQDYLPDSTEAAPASQ